MQFVFFKIQLTDRRLLLVYLDFKIEFFFLQGRRNKMGGNLIGRMDVGWKSNEMKCRRLSVGTPPGRMGVWAYAGYKRRTNWSVVRAKQSLARDCLPERWNR